MVGVRARQCLATQKIAAVSIGHRQRLTSLAITGQEPALEIDAPSIVGGCAIRKGRARMRTAATQFAPYRHPLPIEQFSNCARRRPFDSRRNPLQIGSHLHWPPGRMPSPDFKATLANL